MLLPFKTSRIPHAQLKAHCHKRPNQSTSGRLVSPTSIQPAMGLGKEPRSRLVSVISMILLCGGTLVMAQEQYNITGYDLPCGYANGETACGPTSAQNLAIKAVNELKDVGNNYWKVYAKINAGFSDYFPENMGYYVTCGVTANGTYLAHGLYGDLIGKSPQSAIDSGDIISQHNYAAQVAAITRAGGGWLERTYATANSTRLPYLSRGFYAPYQLPDGTLTYCQSQYQTMPATSTSPKCTADRYTFCSFQVAYNLATVATANFQAMSSSKLTAAIAAVNANLPPYVFSAASGGFYIFLVCRGSTPTFAAHGLYPSLVGSSLASAGFSATEISDMLAIADDGPGWINYNRNGIRNWAFVRYMKGADGKSYLVGSPFRDPTYSTADCFGDKDTACSAVNAQTLVYNMRNLLKTTSSQAVYDAINAKSFNNYKIYPFVFCQAGVNLAHGGNKSFVGLNMVGITTAASFQTTPNLINQLLELGTLGNGAWLTYMWTGLKFKRTFVLPHPTVKGAVIGAGFAANICNKHGNESYTYFDGPCTTEIAYNLAVEASRQLEAATTWRGVWKVLDGITNNTILTSPDGCYLYIFENKYEGVASINNTLVSMGEAEPMKSMTLHKTVPQAYLPKVIWWKIKAAADVGGYWFVHDYRSQGGLYYVFMVKSRQGAFYVATDMAQPYLTGLPPAPISFQP